MVVETYAFDRDEIVTEMRRVLRLRRGPLAELELVLADYRAGRLRDAGELGDVLVLSDLLPADDPLWLKSAR